RKDMLLQPLDFFGRLDAIGVGIEPFDPKVSRYHTKRQNTLSVLVSSPCRTGQRFGVWIDFGDRIENNSNVWLSCENNAKRHPRLQMPIAGRGTKKRRVILKIRLVGYEG